MPEMEFGKCTKIIDQPMRRKDKFYEIAGDFQYEYFTVEQLNSFEVLAKKFFKSARLEIYETGDDLPINYLIGFSKKDGYKPIGFKSLKVEIIK